LFSVTAEFVTRLSRVSPRAPWPTSCGDLRPKSSASTGVGGDARAGFPAAGSWTVGSPRRSRSRGVDVIFRVCTTSGSGYLLHRSGFDLQPLDWCPCRLSRSRLLRRRMTASRPDVRRHRTTPLVIFTSPSESDFRPGLRRVLLPKEQPSTRAPLLRFFAPSAFKAERVHSSVHVRRSVRFAAA